jgi:D-alanyl-D-alanine carboxypeptidase
MRVLACLVVLMVAAGCGGATKQADRPDLQNVLHSLVTGQLRVAPGAVAYVSGTRGTWQGAAGWADVAHRVPMTPDVRSRVGSVSKLWTATVVVKLAEEGKLRLDDTVDEWLPGVFPDGKRITVRELLNHTSGLIDDNDITARPQYWFGKIHDPAVRKELLAVSQALTKNPRATVSPMFEVRVAAALPLLFTPGTDYHYSNIGYKTAGLIAERAGHASLDTMYHRYIIEPLKLRSAGYDPAAAIAGPHALGYVVESGGKAQPNGGANEGAVAASGGIVISAADEARFLVALVQGRILSEPYLHQLETPSRDAYALGTGVNAMCDGTLAYSHGGATTSYMAEVAVSADGKRVAVLLVNGRTWNSWGDNRPEQALRTLFCAA